MVQVPLPLFYSALIRLTESTAPRHRNRSQRDGQSAPAQPSHRIFDDGDGSWDLFSLYSEVTEDDDNSIAKRWQKDAQEIMLFVSPRGCLPAAKWSTRKLS